MSQLSELIRATLGNALSESSAQLVHGGNTYTVYKGYGPALGVEMMDGGFAPATADMSVLLSVDQIKTPDPEQNDRATIDGEACIVSGSITKTPLYWMINLTLSR